MNPIKNILDNYPVLILDGAFATELERRGCNINDSLWSAKVLMENPNIITDVHYDYFKAGADCAITASYQASVPGFMQRGLTEDESIELIKSSVALARKARDLFWEDPDNRTGRPKPLVAGSVGPYGAYLADGSEYRGDYGVSSEELYNFHKPRFNALVEAGADLIACETFPNLSEAKVIVNILKEFPDTYAWVSFSAKNEFQTCGGDALSDCAEYLDTIPNVCAIGINCTSPKFINSLICEIRSKTNKPIVVYPNSGEEYDAGCKCWSGITSAQNYGESSLSWYNHGARLIGGCCRTTPDDIKAVAGILRKKQG